MSPVIRIDDEVMEFLKKKAIALGLVFESPNSTLRYILGIDTKESAEVPAENAAPAIPAAAVVPAPALETEVANPAAEPQSGISFGTAGPSPEPAQETVSANPGAEPKSGISFSTTAPASDPAPEIVAANPAAEPKSGISFGFSEPAPAPAPKKIAADPPVEAQPGISIDSDESPLIKDTITGKTYPSKLAAGKDFKKEFPTASGEFLWYVAIRKYPHRFENIETGESY